MDTDGNMIVTVGEIVQFLSTYFEYDVPLMANRDYVLQVHRHKTLSVQTITINAGSIGVIYFPRERLQQLYAKKRG